MCTGREEWRGWRHKDRGEKQKDDEEEEDEEASLSLLPNFSCRGDKIVPLHSLRQTSLIWRIRWICEKREGGKKMNVQNALNVFHVWLHFCWHFSSVLINMETKLNLWLLVDFLPPSPPPPSLLSPLLLLFPSHLFCQAFVSRFCFFFFNLPCDYIIEYMLKWWNSCICIYFCL